MIQNGHRRVVGKLIFSLRSVNLIPALKSSVMNSSLSNFGIARRYVFIVKRLTLIVGFGKVNNKKEKIKKEKLRCAKCKRIAALKIIFRTFYFLRNRYLCQVISESLYLSGGCLFKSLADFLFGDAKGFKFCAVKSLCVFKKRGVTVFFNIGDDSVYNLLDALSVGFISL